MSRRLIVTQRGEGEPLAIGASTRISGRAEWLSGAYCIMDQVIAPGQLAPVHAHRDEDQVAWVLSGSLVIWVDGDEAELREGGFAVRAAGLPHSMWNRSTEPARFLEITSPAARFQAYMRSLSALNDRGEAGPDTVAELAGRNGITFFPSLTDDLVAQTGLSTAGGFWKEGR